MVKPVRIIYRSTKGKHMSEMRAQMVVASMTMGSQGAQ